MIPSLTGTSIIAVSAFFHCSLRDTCPERETVKEPVVVVEIAQKEARSIAEEQAIALFEPLSVAKFASIPAEVKLDVPFTSQAPRKDWSPPYDEACEETSLAMVEFYLQGKTFSTNIADAEIKYLTSIVERKGWPIDISSSQVSEVAGQTYRRRSHRYTGDEVTIANMKTLLAKGYPIIIPAAGQDLDNPNFQGSGPPYHMLVLTGYNETHFYAHDPGTQFGAHYQYPQEVIANAIHEWTGNKSTVREGEKAMLVLEDKRLGEGAVAAYSF